MIRTILTAAASFALVASISAAAAPPCRDGKGHFAKCPAAAAAMTPAASGVTRDKAGKCHFASGPKKGRFTACPK